MISREFHSLQVKQRNTVLVILFFLLWFLIARFSKLFRYTDFRWIYELGTILTYFSAIVTLSFSLINSVMILKDYKRLHKEDVFWLVGSLYPIIFLFIN